MNYTQKIRRFVKKEDDGLLFLVSVRDNLKAASSLLNGFLANARIRCLIVLFNIEIPGEFTRLNADIKLSEDYLGKKDYEAIDSYIFNDLSKKWYLYKNTTDYRGIRLGAMLEHDFQSYLTPRIKNLEIIRRAVDGGKIKRIVVIEDAGELSDAARLYARHMNLPVLELRLEQKPALSAAVIANVRIRLAAFFSGFLDSIARAKIMHDKGAKGSTLVDIKLYKHLKDYDEALALLPCPLERGARVRFDLIKQGIFYLPLYFQKNRLYRKDWISYSKKWENLSKENGFQDIFVYGGISIWEIVKDKLSIFFREDIPVAISNIRMLEALSKAGRIKIAVMRNNLRALERTLIFGLRLAKIPSLIMQHGLLAETNGDNILFADKFAAWGKASVDWYGKFGNPVDKCEVIGNPLFDIFKDWRPKVSRDEFFRNFKLDRNKQIILFVTQHFGKFSSFWTDDLFLVMSDKVSKALAQFSNKQLVIKLDPYESTDCYARRASSILPDNVVVVKNFDIYTLLYFSDLLITFNSTAALEAMLFDKPVITLNLTKREDMLPYAANQAAIGVYGKEDLSSAIDSVLNDGGLRQRLADGRKRFIGEYAYKLDGGAKERAVKLICRMASGSN